ncbi:hypothetical protein B0T10DRAFT_319092 [Thelonectria olida]|uniref:Uncharacterized protein n=1 Tax=Thelonectria olida TaxID=1576542 RepID=A0A9P9AT45_9HYPO|nr:hypothetical protein B0T10DRAFT_319092 [Thelonectria olida]
MSKMNSRKITLLRRHRLRPISIEGRLAMPPPRRLRRRTQPTSPSSINDNHGRANAGGRSSSNRGQECGLSSRFSLLDKMNIVLELHRALWPRPALSSSSPVSPMRLPVRPPPTTTTNHDLETDSSLCCHTCPSIDFEATQYRPHSFAHIPFLYMILTINYILTSQTAISLPLPSSCSIGCQRSTIAKYISNMNSL